MYIMIVNSYSGRKKYKYISKKINTIKDISFVPYFSHDYQDNRLWIDVQRYIDHNKENIKGIIIIGGDGTFHQGVNHLAHYRIPFGLIPAGSGNDFAKALQIPYSSKKALNRILHGEPEDTDVLQLNDTLVNSVAGMGVDAETALKSSGSRLKNILNTIYLGKLIYLVTFLQVFLTFKPFNLTLGLDNGEKRTFSNVWLMAAGNTSYYGGGIPICPDAAPRDGMMDVTVVYNLSRLKLLLVLPSVFFKLHTKLPYTYTFRTNELSVSTEEKVLIQGDGEKTGITPANVRIKKAYISVF